MRALTVRHPWAAYIADGSKSIETRSWSTEYRGPLLICAGKAFDEAAMAPGSVPQSWRFGHAVCIVRLDDVRPMVEADEPLALVTLAKGRYSWVLSHRVVIDRPFPVRGMPGLFDVAIPNGLTLNVGQAVPA